MTFEMSEILFAFDLSARVLVFGRISVINKMCKKTYKKKVYIKFYIKNVFPGHKKVLSSIRLMDLSVSISSLSANVYPNKFMVGPQIF